MSADDFDALFDQFDRTAFRLEGQLAYNVGGQEAVRLAAFREGRARPERSVRTDPWLARIAITTAQAGKRWQRLRILDNPITDYQRFQLLSGTYLEALACGDETQLLRRADAGPAAEHPDFWLFDRGLPTARAFSMRYSPDGQFLGLSWASGEEIQVMQDIADRIAPAATPLAEYLAGLGVGVA